MHYIRIFTCVKNFLCCPLPYSGKIFFFADGLVNEQRWRILGLVNANNTRDIKSDANQVCLINKSLQSYKRLYYLKA
jgi:hypothetical protein